MVGSVLVDAYRVVRLVGEGGMGTVYEAAQLRLNKRVAVKVMARELASNAEALARFRREAEVTSGIGNPHIVQVFDFGATPTGEPFLVMELLEGEDFERRIRRVGRLSPPATLHIVKQVASALAATHAKGIVHRDLKPANIFLLDVAGETDFVKVVDFGISKVRNATTKLTRSSAVMGTPNYMSPEQALGQVDEIDHRTDQWALACIAWESLSGAGPFVGENVASLLFQVVHQAPQPLLPTEPRLHPAVEEALLVALSKRKADRFASITDFSRALEAAVEGKPWAVVLRPPQEGLSGDDGPVAQGDQRGLSAVSAVASTDSGRPIPTTFTQTSGESEDPLEALPRARPRWIVRLSAIAALGLVSAGFLLLRPGETAKPVSGHRGVPTEGPVSAPLAPPALAASPPNPMAEVEPPPAVTNPESHPPEVPRPIRRQSATRSSGSRQSTPGSRGTGATTDASLPAVPRPQKNIIKEL
jgi:serine/threonine-protein kinase